MAITLYCGLMGSGKSYEGVSSAALSALKRGRRVVTNISGFNFERVRGYLGELEDGSLLEESHVVVVPSSRITEPGFFFDPQSDNESVVKPGDLVLIDEVWQFWGTDVKIHADHMKFFRMHRHYVEQGGGRSCDLVILIQDITSLHRSIRAVVDSVFQFTKLKAVGLNDRYRVDVYEGNKIRKANFLQQFIKKYDPAIFPLYQSYEGGVGKEENADERRNIFSSRSRKIYLATVFMVLLLGVGFLVRGMSCLKDGRTFFCKQVGTSANSAVPPSPTAIAVPATPVAVARPTAVSSSRLVGYVGLPTGETMMLTQNDDGIYEWRRMDGGVLDGWRTRSFVDGQAVVFRMTERKSK